MPFFFLVGSLHFLAPPCDATDSLKPDELKQSASGEEGRVTDNLPFLPLLARVQILLGRGKSREAREARTC